MIFTSFLRSAKYDPPQEKNALYHFVLANGTDYGIVVEDWRDYE